MISLLHPLNPCQYGDPGCACNKCDTRRRAAIQTFAARKDAELELAIQNMAWQKRLLAAKVEVLREKLEESGVRATVRPPAMRKKRVG